MAGVSPLSRARRWPWALVLSTLLHGGALALALAPRKVALAEPPPRPDLWTGDEAIELVEGLALPAAGAADPSPAPQPAVTGDPDAAPSPPPPPTPAPPRPRKTEPRKAEDRKAEDRKATEKKTEDRDANAEKKADEKKADSKKADEKKTEAKPREAKTRPEARDERPADDRKADDRKADDRKADDRKADERRKKPARKADERGGEGQPDAPGQAASASPGAGTSPGQRGPSTVRDLGLAFTRALAPAGQPDRAWAALPAGPGGSVEVAIEVNEEGKLVDFAVLTRDPPAQLVKLVRQALSLLRSGFFAIRGPDPSAGKQLVRLTASMSDVAADADGVPVALSHEYSGGKGKASFTQTSGRKVEVRVELLRVEGAKR